MILQLSTVVSFGVACWALASYDAYLPKRALNTWFALSAPLLFGVVLGLLWEELSATYAVILASVLLAIFVPLGVFWLSPLGWPVNWVTGRLPAQFWIFLPAVLSVWGLQAGAGLAALQTLYRSRTPKSLAAGVTLAAAMIASEIYVILRLAGTRPFN